MAYWIVKTIYVNRMVFSVTFFYDGEDDVMEIAEDIVPVGHVDIRGQEAACFEDLVGPTKVCFLNV